METTRLLELYVFVLAGFVGFFTITRVPALLHTPLMSATNAITAISLVGSLVAGRRRPGAAADGARLRRRDLGHHQRGGRLHHHRPHAEDVPAGRPAGGAPVSPRTALIEAAYLAASVLFILGLRSLTVPDRARRGMQLAALGMLVAVVGTLLHHEIVRYQWILAGLVLGSLIGYPLGVFMPMTAMPQRIALSHTFGALAATLVGRGRVPCPGAGSRGGARADGGARASRCCSARSPSPAASWPSASCRRSSPARRSPSRARTWSRIGDLPGGAGALRLAAGRTPANPAAFYVMVGLALVFGVLLVLPIGGADMPVVISLLNSYAGLAASATGFAIDNNVLIIAGALDGASGFFLSILMSRAMNRSFANVLFGAFGAVQPRPSAGRPRARPSSATRPEDAAIQLWTTRGSVIVVPGYGMAVAQAQHAGPRAGRAARAERRSRCTTPSIPVAGRMPGHMNVLLAEANVPYDQLMEMDQINDEFPNTDVALVSAPTTW